jgi:hypothetical protein
MFLIADDEVFRLENEQFASREGTPERDSFRID